MNHQPFFSLAVVSLFAAALCACGKPASTEKQASTEPGKAAAAKVEPQAAAPAGALKESSVFKILVPAGWEFASFDDGTVQVFNRTGTYMVEAKKAGMNMTEADVEKGVASLVTQYGGTPPATVEMLGLKFFKTTYTAASRKQTLHSAIKDGAKISIALMGPDHETDATIQAVLKSVALK